MKQLITTIAVSVLAILPVVGQQIQSGQAINITIQSVPDQDRSTINGTYPVSQSGTINMPFLGTVRAAGMLPEQLAVSLQNQFKSAEIFTRPIIQVVATSSDSIVQQVVHLGGDVRRPGAVPFTNGLTLYQALQQGGGANEFGSIRRIILYRNGELRRYDLRTQEAKQLPLRPNDTIEVPRKGIFER